MRFECGLSTEQLLHETPIELVRKPDIDGPRGDYRYLAVRRSDGQTVGGTRIVHWSDGSKELNQPYVYNDYLGQGNGLAIYVAANRTPHDSGENAPLQSQLVFLSDSAKRVWESLVSREVAFVKNPDYLQYQFQSTDI
jgi:hypothetical protein